MFPSFHNANIDRGPRRDGAVSLIVASVQGPMLGVEDDSETMRLSRPNGATNHGGPAAGMKAMWFVPLIGKRSAAISASA